MRVITTRGGRLMSARVTQPHPEKRWEGIAADGFTATGDTAEECRDALCDGPLSVATLTDLYFSERARAA